MAPDPATIRKLLAAWAQVSVARPVRSPELPSTVSRPVVSAGAPGRAKPVTSFVESMLSSPETKPWPEGLSKSIDPPRSATCSRAEEVDPSAAPIGAEAETTRVETFESSTNSGSVPSASPAVSSGPGQTTRVSAVGIRTCSGLRSRVPGVSGVRNDVVATSTPGTAMAAKVTMLR